MERGLTGRVDDGVEVLLLQRDDAVGLQLRVALQRAHLVHVLVVEEAQVGVLVLQPPQARLHVCNTRGR